jgi:hypothetical protein
MQIKQTFPQVRHANDLPDLSLPITSGTAEVDCLKSWNVCFKILDGVGETKN